VEDRELNEDNDSVPEAQSDGFRETFD